MKLTARQTEVLQKAMENGAVACPELVQWVLDNGDEGESPPKPRAPSAEGGTGEAEGIFDQPKIIIQPLNGRLCI